MKIEVPRRSKIAQKDGRVSEDWDATFFQVVAAIVGRVQSGGTFANNAAAVAGGLAVGQFYQTAAGEVRVVV